MTKIEEFFYWYGIVSALASGGIFLYMALCFLIEKVIKCFNKDARRFDGD